MTQTRNIEDNISQLAINYTKAGEGWQRLEDIAGDLSKEEIAEAVQELITADEFRAEPQWLNSRISDWDRANAPMIGGEARHLIWWE